MNFLRKCQIVFWSAYFISHQRHMRILVVPHPYNTWYGNLFNRYVVVFDCGFNFLLSKCQIISSIIFRSSFDISTYIFWLILFRYVFFINFFFFFRGTETGLEGERGRFVPLIYAFILRLLLVRALTRDWTCSLGVLGQHSNHLAS